MIQNEKTPDKKPPPSLKKALGFLLTGVFFVLLPFVFEYYSNPSAQGTPQQIDEIEQVVLHTAKGEVKLFAEVARSPEQQRVGLMFRQFMPLNKGMLFIQQNTLPNGTSFWMKNTWLPLDIIFIGPSGRVVHVAHKAQPLNETPVGTTQPVKAVLEINAGLAQKWGLQLGDRITSSSLTD